MSTPTTSKPRTKATTPEALLDREEALAIQRLTGSIQRVSDEIIEAVDLRARIRRNPWIAVGIGATAGFLGGPFVLRLLKNFSSASSVARTLVSPQSTNLQSLALAYARELGTRR